MRDYQTDYMGYVGSLIGCYSAMPEHEKDELHAWEEKYVTGSCEYGTSDWPGWKKYIGTPPDPQKYRNDDRSGYIYLIKCGVDTYKIGYAKSVKSRLAQLQTGNPIKIELVHKFIAINAREMEANLHSKYRKHQLRNEWYSLPKECVDEICNISGNEVVK